MCRLLNLVHFNLDEGVTEYAGFLFYDTRGLRLLLWFPSSITFTKSMATGLNDGYSRGFAATRLPAKLNPHPETSHQQQTHRHLPGPCLFVVSLPETKNSNIIKQNRPSLGSHCGTRLSFAFSLFLCHQQSPTSILHFKPLTLTRTPCHRRKSVSSTFRPSRYYLIKQFLLFTYPLSDQHVSISRPKSNPSRPHLAGSSTRDQGQMYSVRAAGRLNPK